MKKLTQTLLSYFKSLRGFGISIILLLTFVSVPFITTDLYFGLNWYYPVIITLFFVLVCSFTLDILKNDWKIYILEKNHKDLICLWIILCFGFFLFGLYHLFFNYSLIEMRVFIGNLVKFTIIVVLIIYLTVDYEKFTDGLLFLVAIMSLLSIILFLLITFDLYPIKPAEVHYKNRLNYNFWLGNSNVYLRSEGGQTIRISGFLEEPGAFALILTFSIVLNEWFRKSTLLHGIFIVAGILTFSLAFYISLGIFIVYFLLKKLKFITYLQLFSCFLIFIYYAAFFSSNTELSNLVKYTIARFTYDPITGGFGGNYNRFEGGIETKSLGFGNGLGADPGVFSIQTYLSTYGLFVGITSFLFLPFLLVSVLKKKGSPAILLWLVIAINFIQRPDVALLPIMVFLTLIYLAPGGRVARYPSLG